MNALVVYAHPSGESFNAAVMSAVVGGLENGGHSIRTIDLYDETFEAVMSRDERIAYKTDSPILDDQVAHHVKMLKSSDALVFVYPTWFFGMPAIMKGWLDRVMLPGVAFVFDEDGRVRPGLDNIERLVGVSTYGSTWLATKLMTDSGRRTVKRTLRMVSSRGVRTAWHGLYRMDASSPADRTRFLDTVRSHMAKL